MHGYLTLLMTHYEDKRRNCYILNDPSISENQLLYLIPISTISVKPITKSEKVKCDRCLLLVCITIKTLKHSSFSIVKDI